MSTRIRYRRARYWLWAVTRDDRPDRRADAWIDTLRAMNADESWEGLRFRAGRLVDARGRFAAPADTPPNPAADRAGSTTAAA